MPGYRFYNVNEHGHVIGRPAIKELMTDPDAVREAQDKLLDGNDVEIWQGARLVARVNSPVKKSARWRMNFLA